jgi:CRP/FNR family transcriptional regulator, nitrogen oxide reductase regulator
MTAVFTVEYRRNSVVRVGRLVLMNFHLQNRASFLERLDQQTVNAILEKAEKRQVKAGRMLQTAGEAGKHLCILQNGRARYYKTTLSGDEITLRVLGPGDVFGLVTLLARPMSYMVNVDAVSDCNLFVWRHVIIRTFAEAHPQLAENALLISLRYLKGYTDRHARLISGTGKERLGATLLHLAHRTGSVRPHGIEIDVTNEHLGSLSDISRFTTSRLLNVWQREGTLSKSRGKITLHTPEGLTSD